MYINERGKELNHKRQNGARGAEQRGRGGNCCASFGSPNSMIVFVCCLPRFISATPTPITKSAKSTRINLHSPSYSLRQSATGRGEEIGNHLHRPLKGSESNTGRKWKLAEKVETSGICTNVPIAFRDVRFR